MHELSDRFDKLTEAIVRQNKVELVSLPNTFGGVVRINPDDVTCLNEDKTDKNKTIVLFRCGEFERVSLPERSVAYFLGKMSSTHRRELERLAYQWELFSRWHWRWSNGVTDREKHMEKDIEHSNTYDMSMRDMEYSIENKLHGHERSMF